MLSILAIAIYEEDDEERDCDSRTRGDTRTHSTHIHTHTFSLTLSDSLRYCIGRHSESPKEVGTSTDPAQQSPLLRHFGSLHVDAAPRASGRASSW